MSHCVSDVDKCDESNNKSLGDAKEQGVVVVEQLVLCADVVARARSSEVGCGCLSSALVT